MPEIDVRPIQAGDLAKLSATAAEVMARPYMDGAESLPAIAFDPYAATMTVDGEPVASGGIADFGHGVGVVWAIFAQPLPRCAVLPLIRTLKAVIEDAPFHWIEAQTPTDLPTGLKLDKVLGFEPIGTMTMNGRTFIRLRYTHGH